MTPEQPPRFPRLNAIRRYVVDHLTHSRREKGKQLELQLAYSTLVDRLKNDRPERFPDSSSKDQLRVDYLFNGSQISIATIVSTGSDVPENPSKIQVIFPYRSSEAALEITRDAQGQYAIFDRYEDPEIDGVYGLTRIKRKKINELLNDQLPNATRKYLLPQPE